MKLIASSLFILLLLPMQASAMVRPFFNTNTNVVGTATRFHSIEAANMNASSNLISHPMPIAGVIANMRVNMLNTASPPGSGTSYAFELMLNGSTNAAYPGCTIADLATTCSDTTRSVTVAPGDLVTWRSTPTNTPLSTAVKFSATFEGTTAGETITGGNTFVAYGTSAQTNYWPISGGAVQATEASASVIAPTNFTLDRLYVASPSAAGTSNSWTYTLYKNGSPTGLTTSISGAAQVGNNDPTNSVSVSAGDTLSMQIVVAGTPTARFQKWQMRLTPTIDGESVMWGSRPTAITNNATRYMEVTNTFGNVTAINEDQTQAPAPVDFIIRKGNWTIEPTPGSTKTWAITLRKGGANQSLTGTIVDGSTNITDSSNSVSVSTGDLFNWQTVPTNTPTATTRAMFSAVAYIAPSAAAAGGQMRFLNLGTMLLQMGTLIFR